MKRGRTWMWVGLCVSILAACTGAAEDETIVAWGFVEGEETVLAPEAGGRIAEFLVAEGEDVQAGQVLVHLDDALLQVQRAQAQAALAAAQANLARVREGARPEEVAAARGLLRQAEARYAGALRAVDHAQAAIDDPQELDAQIAAAQTQVRLGEQAVELARAELAAVRLQAGLAGSDDARRVSDLQIAAAEAALDLAQADLDGRRQQLSLLHAMRSDPLQGLAELHAAQAELRAAEAEVQIVRAELEGLQARPRLEEVALALAQVQQAQAALGIAEAQLAQLTLSAPIDGSVSSRPLQAGETVQAGQTLLTLTNLDWVVLSIYVPGDQIGHVQTGQPVDVRPDAFPGQPFPGHVFTVAGQAEFTPRNAQTQEQQAGLVFEVQVRVPNPDHRLRPGMPAEASIAP